MYSLTQTDDDRADDLFLWRMLGVKRTKGIKRKIYKNMMRRKDKLGRELKRMQKSRNSRAKFFNRQFSAMGYWLCLPPLKAQVFTQKYSSSL